MLVDDGDVDTIVTHYLRGDNDVDNYKKWDVPSIKGNGFELDGKYSRRINIQHRLVYDVDEDKKQIHIVSMWSHYEDAEK